MCQRCSKQLARSDARPGFSVLKILHKSESRTRVKTTIVIFCNIVSSVTVNPLIRNLRASEYKFHRVPTVLQTRSGTNNNNYNYYFIERTRVTRLRQSLLWREREK